jgi:hypothetical protein
MMAQILADLKQDLEIAEMPMLILLFHHNMIRAGQ